MFAILWNCSKRFLGRMVSSVYRVVTCLLCNRRRPIHQPRPPCSMGTPTVMRRHLGSSIFLMNCTGPSARVRAAAAALEQLRVASPAATGLPVRAYGEELRKKSEVVRKVLSAAAGRRLQLQGVHPSAPAHYRTRAEFGVWWQGGTPSYVRYEGGGGV